MSSPGKNKFWNWHLFWAKSSLGRRGPQVQQAAFQSEAVSSTHQSECLSEQWRGRLSVYCCCSVSKLCPTLQPHGLHHTSLPCPSLSPWVCSNSCPLSWWCHPTILSSVAPFSSCPQSFLASGSFPRSWLFISGGQSIGASASVLPMNIQGWFLLGLTGLISLLSKGLSRVTSSSTIWKHQLWHFTWYTLHIC